MLAGKIRLNMVEELLQQESWPEMWQAIKELPYDDGVNMALLGYPRHTHMVLSNHGELQLAHPNGEISTLESPLCLVDLTDLENGRNEYIPITTEYANTIRMAMKIKVLQLMWDKAADLEGLYGRPVDTPPGRELTGDLWALSDERMYLNKGKDVLYNLVEELLDR